VVHTGEPAREGKEGGRREGRPDPKPPRPSRQSNGAEESERGKAASMAQALRERGGKRYNGTQGTRQLSTRNVVDAWRHGRDRKGPALGSRMRRKSHVRVERGAWGNVPKGNAP
jgi:hypothetical protein